MVVSVVDKEIVITLNLILAGKQKRELFLEIPQHYVMPTRRVHLKFSIKTTKSTIGNIEQKGLSLGGDPNESGDVLVQKDPTFFGSHFPPDVHFYSESEYFSEGVDSVGICCLEEI